MICRHRWCKRKFENVSRDEFELFYNFTLVANVLSNICDGNAQAALVSRRRLLSTRHTCGWLILMTQRRLLRESFHTWQVGKTAKLIGLTRFANVSSRRGFLNSLIIIIFLSVALVGCYKITLKFNKNSAYDAPNVCKSITTHLDSFSCYILFLIFDKNKTDEIHRLGVEHSFHITKSYMQDQMEFFR